MSAKREAVEDIQIPLIRTKRSHRKSRGGCLRCKQRRVKCDEKRPRCTACLVRASECTYRGNGQPAVPVKNPNDYVERLVSACGKVKVEKSESDGSSSNDSSPRPVAESQLQISETELVQTYLSRVAHTLLQSNWRPEQHWFYHVFIPSLSYTSQAVRYGMMTLAAIFLHFEHKNIGNESPYSTKYVDAANFYGSMFVEQSRQKLSRLDPSETNANIACSRLLLILALAFHREYRSTGLDYGDPGAWKWTHLLQGIKTVFIEIMASGQVVDPVLLLDMTPESPLGSDPSFMKQEQPLSSYHTGLLAYIERTQYDRFAALRTMVCYSSLEIDDEQRDHCLSALEKLIRINEQVIAMSGRNIFRVLGAWIGQVPLDFLYMLEHGHLAAQAIYAHWLMLLMLAEGLWVIDDMGRAGIESILAGSEGIVDMEHVLQWPQEMLGFIQP